jgi:hypothetical protein
VPVCPFACIVSFDKSAGYLRDLHADMQLQMSLAELPCCSSRRECSSMEQNIACVSRRCLRVAPSGELVVSDDIGKVADVAKAFRDILPASDRSRPFAVASRMLKQCPASAEGVDALPYMFAAIGVWLDDDAWTRVRKSVVKHFSASSGGVAECSAVVAPDVVPVVPDESAQGVQDAYDEMSPEALRMQCRRDALLIAELRGKLNCEQTRRRYWTRVATQRKQQLLDLKIDMLAARLKSGKSERYFSLKGGMSLAVRRNLSHISTASLGMTLCEDVSSRTVTSWERRLGSALVAASRNFHR